MTVNISPVFGGGAQLFSNQGVVLAGGKIYTYLAGTTTPQNTYTDSTGATPNANPIILDSAGRVTTAIYLTSGVQYKFAVTDSADASVGPPLDYISGVNDFTAPTQDQWQATGMTPTYISGTQFSVSGNQTATFTVGRRTKIAVTAGTVYGTVSASSFGTGITTVTVVNDSTSLDSGISTVSVGLLTPTNQSADAFAVAYHDEETYLGTKTVGGAIQQMQTPTTTGGTSTAFTLTLNPVAGAYTRNASWLVKFHTGSGAAPTLNVSSLGAKNLKMYDASGAKVAASFVSGLTCPVIYDGTDMIVCAPVPANMAMELLTTGGSSTAYTLTPTVPATSNAKNVWAVKFHTGSGAAPTMNISGLGAVNLKQFDSTGTKAAAVIYTNQVVLMLYDGTDFIIVQTLTSNSAGAVSLGTNGYQKVPGGLIIQWGTTTFYNPAGTSADVVSTATWPIAFGTNCAYAAAEDYTSGGTPLNLSFGLTTSVMTYVGVSGLGTSTARWFAMGY